MMTFERLDIDAVDWEQLYALPDRTVHTQRPVRGAECLHSALSKCSGGRSCTSTSWL
jgi:hypothetical protein